jgi:hypothetical protein
LWAGLSANKLDLNRELGGAALKRLLLGVAAMIGIQICFGLASDAIDSLPALIVLVLSGFFAASACGSLVARRGFVIPAVAVCTFDFALCGYVLATDPGFSYTNLAMPIFALYMCGFMCGALVAVILGAKLGQLIGRRRSAVKTAA